MQVSNLRLSPISQKRANQRELMQANIERAIKLSEYKWDANNFLKQETIYTKDFSYVDNAQGVKMLL